MEIEESRASGWVAWVLFGGILLVLLGAVHLTIGLVALLKPEVLADTRAEHLLSVPLTALAWVHLVLGVVALVTGVGLVRGVTWARFVALGIALLAALVNFAFIAVHPAWSVIAIALATLIAWAVVAHGGEVADAYGR
ncbi:vacuolar-type H+-ATPase subunit I/STV1 [Actinoplanes octamycinicus]|uniref:Vacuolar-type H+-ATPase subunit I/STV1 n=1 Tax=Actinoplanes octamycinicus TaxID=135948 RepID=A0A7W7M7S8_9ACTN|nr:hypothetical protein [Actinoplanes octamycinicus]MBB4740130.1 vacuolar-type H+-ATPase subunit I/STV1 [Actinoplanes octamycinicus]GIE59527.1 hypothetical protein Aoc01nite_49290 [Actinoplanes octamycinicus]